MPCRRTRATCAATPPTASIAGRCTASDIAAGPSIACSPTASSRPSAAAVPPPIRTRVTSCGLSASVLDLVRFRAADAADAPRRAGPARSWTSTSSNCAAESLTVGSRGKGAGLVAGWSPPTRAQSPSWASRSRTRTTFPRSCSCSSTWRWPRWPPTSSPLVTLQLNQGNGDIVYRWHRRERAAPCAHPPRGQRSEPGFHPALVLRAVRDVLQRMESVKEGNGTLLDNTLVVIGNEFVSGTAHDTIPGRCSSLAAAVGGSRRGRNIVYPAAGGGRRARQSGHPDRRPSTPSSSPRSATTWGPWSRGVAPSCGPAGPLLSSPSGASPGAPPRRMPLSPASDLEERVRGQSSASTRVHSSSGSSDARSLRVSLLPARRRLRRAGNLVAERMGAARPRRQAVTRPPNGATASSTSLTPATWAVGGAAPGEGEAGDCSPEGWRGRLRRRAVGHRRGSALPLSGGFRVRSAGPRRLQLPANAIHRRQRRGLAGQRERRGQEPEHAQAHRQSPTRHPRARWRRQAPGGQGAGRRGPRPARADAGSRVSLHGNLGVAVERSCPGDRSVRERHHRCLRSLGAPPP